MNRLIIDVEETSGLLRCRKAEVYELLESGELPAYREGSRWKIPLSTLERYVEERAISEARARRLAAKGEEDEEA